MLVIGEAADRPIVTIMSGASEVDYANAKKLDSTNGVVGRLSSALQAVPSILVASQSQGKQLMEVVVNGNLIRAADGAGFRGFVVGPKGIQEQARLFEAGKLQNMVSAAAFWQVASVLVAQKHLADISQKLDEIKQGIDRISRFLEVERRARIQATYQYLYQAYQAFTAGELSDSLRYQLENCERDLLAIQLHLINEYKNIVTQSVEHRDFVGTGDLKDDIEKKIVYLNCVKNDLFLCFKTRVAAWHLLSLYPGEPALRAARRQDITTGLEEMTVLSNMTRTQLDLDTSNIRAFWNKKSTLQERRAAVRSKTAEVIHGLASNADKQKAAISLSTALLEDATPTRIILEIQNGLVVEARQAA